MRHLPGHARVLSYGPEQRVCAEMADAACREPPIKDMRRATATSGCGTDRRRPERKKKKGHGAPDSGRTALQAVLTDRP